MYAQIIIEYPVKSLDKSFTYLIPIKYRDIVKIGMKVKVPFSKSIVNGIVMGINDIEPDYDVKEIISVDAGLCLNEEQLLIGKFLQKETLCTLITAYQTMLPAPYKIKNNKDYTKYEEFLELVNEEKANEYIALHPRTFKQIECLELLLNGKQPKEIFDNSIVKLLKEKELVRIEKKQKYRIDIMDILSKENKLNDEQQNAFNKVKSNINKYNIFLLQGVTGSGKTEVYMHLISEVIKNGKSAIVLVPEICLTTQTVQRFYERFGSNVAIFHSGLSIGEKHDEYQKILRDEVKIVVGTRSSIFVPIKNPGIIIIDEEHSDSYYQESNPRYNAIDVAKFRAQYHNIPLLLCSATPSLESKARASKGVYELLLLNKRANNLSLPDVTLIDMVEEVKKRNFIFSDLLKERIADRLEKKEQIILLLNRRGFSTFITCGNCGYTYKCPNCDITLTYHKTSENLRCHYCGYYIKKDEFCPKCGEKSLNYLGLGTQKLEDEIKKLFPLARTLRMDQDTTSKKGSYQKIIDAFSNFEYDILLGTQMISKGLDFKNVTLVGIINADTSLNIPDFRANEKTFDLLYQTSGRAGRFNKKGDVLIQTFNADNDTLKFVKDNDYEGFFVYEMNIRHNLKYPPYTFIATINVKSKSYDEASINANKIHKFIRENIDKKSLVYGPTPASVFKVNNVYNFQIIIKYTSDNKLHNILKQLDESYITNNLVNIEISFNPSHF